MSAATLTKGSRMEVSSDDIGFLGSWYVATLVDVVEASPTKKKSSSKKNRNTKKTGYFIKYDSLFADDSLTEHLTEIVDPAFVRPLPPRNPRRNIDNNDNEAEAEGGDGGVFELLDVVDAYHRDGWWIGVVTKVVIDGEVEKYTVSFESPPEEFEFEKSQLRLHVDWIDCRWQVRPKKILQQESDDKNTTKTLESNDDAHSCLLATPSKGALMIDHSQNLTVGSQLSAKKKSHSRKKSETNADTVVVDGSVTCSRNKRFRNSIEENSSGSNGNTKAIVTVMESSSSQALHQDSLHLEQEMIIIGSCETGDGKSQQKRKRGRPPKLQLNTTDGLLEGSSCCNTLDHCDEPTGALKPTIINNGQITMYHEDWPFIKQSPIWATIESLEPFQKPPQTPHFSPLKKIKEDYREGLAIAHILTFGNVVQRTSKLQLADPNEVINNSLETLLDLENHGFDVGAVRARLNELLSKKAKVGQLEDELKEVENELKKRDLEKSILEEEMSELELKMQELQEKMVQIVKTKNIKDGEVANLRTKLQVVANRIVDMKVVFGKVAASPL